MYCNKERNYYYFFLLNIYVQYIYSQLIQLLLVINKI